MHIQRPSIGKKVILFALLGMLALAVVAFASCGEVGPSTQDQERETQDAVLKRGLDSQPIYQIQNFLSREAINKWLERMDTPNKLWYVYLMTESGAFIGYHVCNTVPLSYGVSLTNPSEKVTGRWGNVTMPAPGLDAVYYTGTDPTVHFCFDAETDALVTFNVEFVYYDKPLNVDAPRLRLEVEE